MLAHVEELHHLHPHPAGVPWELVALGVLATLVAVVVLAVRRGYRPLRPSVTPVEAPGTGDTGAPDDD